MRLKYQRFLIDRITIDAFARMSHSNVDEIAKSIKSDTIWRSITLGRVQRKYYVIEGRSRLKAMKQLNRKVIPATVVICKNFAELRHQRELHKPTQCNC